MISKSCEGDVHHACDGRICIGASEREGKDYDPCTCECHSSPLPPAEGTGRAWAACPECKGSGRTDCVDEGARMWGVPPCWHACPTCLHHFAALDAAVAARDQEWFAEAKDVNESLEGGVPAYEALRWLCERMRGGNKGAS